jgi:hypothetical protein
MPTQGEKNRAKSGTGNRGTKEMLIPQFTTPYSQKVYKELLLNTPEQKELAAQFNLHL